MEQHAFLTVKDRFRIAAKIMGGRHAAALTLAVPTLGLLCGTMSFLTFTTIPLSVTEFVQGAVTGSAASFLFGISGVWAHKSWRHERDVMLAERQSVMDCVYVGYNAESNIVTLKNHPQTATKASDKRPLFRNLDNVVPLDKYRQDRRAVLRARRTEAGSLP